MPAHKRSLHEEPNNTATNNDEQQRHDEVEVEVDEDEEDDEKDGSFQQNGHLNDLKKQPSFDDQNQEDEEDELGEEEEEVEEEEDGDEEEEEEAEGSEGTQSSSSSEDEKEKPEYVIVELPEIRKDVQCPICLGIIKKTRTVMECLHRFCRECIDKSMRLGNNECPACRTHCASRRSLRDDPNYDTLIAALYPDIDKYEEEELAFHEEERTRNKQIQASIAQIFQRQSEALVRRRTMGKETGSFMTRSQRNHRITTRRRRSSRGTEFGGSEENEEENDDNGGKDSSSADERSTEVRPKRRRRRSGARNSQPSPSVVNSEGGCTENDTGASRENRGISPGLVWNTEMLVWGRGGTRSHTRHGNAAGCNSKSARNTRLSKLVEYLRSLEEKNDELDIHLMLVSLDKQSTPSLQQPYLCCRQSLSVRHLCEYVAHQTPLSTEEIEILLVKRRHSSSNNLSTPTSTDELHILKSQDTLAGLKAYCATGKDQLILAYRQKS